MRCSRIEIERNAVPRIPDSLLTPILSYQPAKWAYAGARRTANSRKQLIVIPLATSRPGNLEMRGEGDGEGEGEGKP